MLHLVNKERAEIPAENQVKDLKKEIARLKKLIIEPRVNKRPIKRGNTRKEGMLNLNRISRGINKLKKQTKGPNQLLVDKKGNGM